MHIQSANVAPDFSARRQLHAQDLRRLVEPAVIFEHHGIDSDEAHFYVYTVAGWLDGENIATIQGGATIGGDVIVIHADDRDTADFIAGMGLQDTINALENEEAATLDALAAKARLESVGAVERLDLSTRSDKPDAFVEDIDKIRPLIGDDIILAGGH
jgi:hypothetical protein